MKVTLLGTGSPVPSAKRASASYLVETGGAVILIDHGPGAFARLMQAGRTAADVTHVFFSHLHFDHVADFIRLFHHRWDGSGDEMAPMQVFGPPGTQAFVDRLFGPEGAFAADLTARTRHPLSTAIYKTRGGTPPRPWPDTRVTELAGPGATDFDGWRIERREVPHVQPYLDSFGFRVEAGGRAFAYTSDVNLALAEPAPGLFDLARDADLLVHYLNAFPFEATGPGGFAGARLVARLARDAGAKTLVTSHHGGFIDRDGVRERVIAELAAVFPGRLVWGEDLMSFAL